MTKDEAIEAFRKATYERFIETVPENTPDDIRLIAEQSAVLYADMNARSFEYNFEVLKGIFEQVLTEKD